MRMNTPRFWYDDTPGAKATATALGAFSAVYVLGHMIHQAIIRPVKAPLPVICIGNLVAGGGGKTPMALEVMQILRQNSLFKNPCFLSRGYGGREKGPVLVDSARHNAPDVGDEPLLLARAAPVVVSADRIAGANFAHAQGFDAVIMDDGLQNPSLHKDFSILVVDGAAGFGNGQLLPAGPLRTPVKAGLAKVDCVMITGPDMTGVTENMADKLVLKAQRVPVSLLDTLPEYVAFCGIARPEKFWQTLDEAELKIAEFHRFPDHHQYNDADLQMLTGQAKAFNARLVTTAKDAVRIPPSMHDHIDVMEIGLEWAEGDAAKLAARLAEIAHA